MEMGLESDWVQILDLEALCEFKSWIKIPAKKRILSKDGCTMGFLHNPN